MTYVIRRHSRRRTHRKPVLLQLSGLWHPCDDYGHTLHGAPVELGVVRGLLHTSRFGGTGRDMVEVTEGPFIGRWLPV